MISYIVVGSVCLVVGAIGGGFIVKNNYKKSIDTLERLAAMSQYGCIEVDKLYNKILTDLKKKHGIKD